MVHLNYSRYLDERPLFPGRAHSHKRLAAIARKKKKLRWGGRRGEEPAGRGRSSNHHQLLGNDFSRRDRTCACCTCLPIQSLLPEYLT